MNLGQLVAPRVLLHLFRKGISDNNNNNNGSLHDSFVREDCPE